MFWQHPHFRDLSLLKARFRDHRYDLHTHATYVIALITDGCERLRVGRQRALAPADAIILVNPEECHDGEAGCEQGWSYRTFYPTVALMREVARELGHATVPVFPRTVVTDTALAASLARAHRCAEQGDAAAAEATMLLSLRDLIICHADGDHAGAACTVTGSARRVATYRSMIEADIAAAWDLHRLAHATGVTRFQVIRDFKQVTGLTPSAFIRDHRVRLAGDLIRQGDSLANAAQTAGFADQSHFSRAFKLSHGVTPGSLRRAVRAAR